MKKKDVLIPQFFAGKNVFITGGTGFMGRVLIEKLIRSCPDINQIFILMRTKKGKSLTERLELMKNLALFSVVNETFPERLDKLIPIEGDVSLLKMGVSKENFDKMKNVSIIFHAAATVRFDDPLKDAILLNTRGTLEVLKFAESLKDLKVMVHVSTAYCNLNRENVEEKVYPSLADWRSSIKTVEELDEDTLNSMAAHFTSFMPNTYTFSKHLAEQIVSEYSVKLPTVICRPTVVINTLRDPFPGWIDNFNGPVGILIGAATGILRTMYADPEAHLDYIPVDVAIKVLISSAWLKGKENFNSGLMPIYNCGSNNIWRMHHSFVSESGKKLIEERPIKQCTWIPGGNPTKIYCVYWIRVVFCHILVGIFYDFLLKLQGKKQFILSLHRKAFNAMSAIEPFLITWNIKNEQFVCLHDKIQPEDIEVFGFMDFKNVSKEEAYKIFCFGALKYLLGENEEHASKARIKYNRMETIEVAFKISIISFVVYFLFKSYIVKLTGY